MRRALLGCVVVVGCGKVPARAVDADTSAPTGPVEVRVFAGDPDIADDPPAIGATVLFHRADGSLAATATTDDDGRASADLAAGDAITVVRVRADGADLTTILAVAPDDHLAIGRRRYYEWTDEEAARFTLASAAGATSYAVYAPCSQATATGGSTEVTVTMNDRCGATYDAIAVAFDAPGGAPVGYVYLPPRARPTAEIDVASIGAWAPMPNLTATFTGVPTGVTFDAFTGLVLSDLARFSRYAVATPTGTTAAYTVPMPLDSGHMQFDVRLRRAADLGPLRLARRGAATTSYTLDLAPTLAPFLGTPTFDPATGVAAVAVDGGGRADALSFDLAYAHDGATYTWRIHAPGELTEVALPSLPASLAALAPRVGDVTDARARTLRVDDGVGYDGVRGELDRNVEVGFEPWLRRDDITWVTLAHDPETPLYPPYFPEP
ncbi:MAG: hypothetical protein R2939_12590 [Kofleriaceae bacterium]